MERTLVRVLVNTGARATAAAQINTFHDIALVGDPVNPHFIIMFRNIKNVVFIWILEPMQRKWLTIRVFDELYELQVLPFGINIGPKVLHAVLQKVLESYKTEALLYRDDLVIPNKNDVAEIIQVLQQNGFIVKTPQEIGKHEIKLLGFKSTHSSNIWVWILETLGTQLQREELCNPSHPA
jgi:hypothetical protein